LIYLSITPVEISALVLPDPTQMMRWILIQTTSAL